jgi:hypothetical protein
MKYTIASLVALACASSSLAVTLGTAPAVTVALTASTTVGGFKVVDPETKEVSYEAEKITEKTDKNGDVVLSTTEEKEVPSVVRVGNAQLLQAMAEDGQLDVTDPKLIKGWSIVAVSSLDDAGESGPSGLFAVKKGQDPVEIEVEFSSYAASYTASGKETYTPATEAYVRSFSASGKYLTEFSFFGFNLQGVSTFSEKYVKGTFGKGAASVSYEGTLAGATKIAGISGVYGDEDTDESALAEGSISTAAEVVLNLETLGFASAQQPE